MRRIGTFKDRGTTFRLTGGAQELGKAVVEELLLDWLEPVFDGGRAGHAAGLTPSYEPLTRLEELIPSWKGDGVFTGESLAIRNTKSP